MSWNIQDGEGVNFCEGIQFERQARNVAQDLANEHGESVWIYESGSEDLEEIKPESD